MNNSISVIIPIFNAQKTIKECVKSVITHLDKELKEIILVDDGSTDLSSRICDQMAKENPLVHVFHQSNLGVSAARNTGLRRATGEWIMFVDADDLLISSPLVKMDNLSDQTEIIYYAKSNPEQKKIFLNNTEQLILAILGRESIYNNIDSLLFSACSKLYNRKFLIKSSICFDPKLRNGEDMIFNLQCVKAGARFVWFNQSLYHYIENRNSATHIYNKNMIENDKVFLEQLKNLDLNISQQMLDAITITGLFLVIRKAIAHKDSPETFKRKKKQVYEICESDLYKGALNRWDFFKSNEKLPRKIVLLLCKIRVYGIAIFIASI